MSIFCMSVCMFICQEPLLLPIGFFRSDSHTRQILNKTYTRMLHIGPNLASRRGGVCEIKEIKIGYSVYESRLLNEQVGPQWLVNDYREGWFVEPVDRLLHFHRYLYMHSHSGQWLIRSRERWNLICRRQGKIDFAVWLMQGSKMAS